MKSAPAGAHLVAVHPTTELPYSDIDKIAMSALRAIGVVLPIDPRNWARRLGFRLLPLSLDAAHEADDRTTARQVAYCAEATDAERDPLVIRSIARALLMREHGGKRPMDTDVVKLAGVLGRHQKTVY